MASKKRPKKGNACNTDAKEAKRKSRKETIHLKLLEKFDKRRELLFQLEKEGKLNKKQTAILRKYKYRKEGPLEGVSHEKNKNKSGKTKS